jgi:hypothetical protein
MARSRSSLAWFCIAVGVCGACDVYHDDLARVELMPDASDCLRLPETCNGRDDDCDGRVDEGDGRTDGGDALHDCEQRVLNAESVCAKAQCVNLACDPGWSSCDGHPENGCECPDDGGTGAP